MLPNKQQPSSIILGSQGENDAAQLIPSVIGLLLLLPPPRPPPPPPLPPLPPLLLLLLLLFHKVKLVFFGSPMLFTGCHDKYCIYIASMYQSSVVNTQSQN